MVDLAYESIDLWAVFPDEIRDGGLLAAYRRLLTPEELEQHQRFRFDADRHRYLLTRALVRTTLSRYASIAPEKWRFATNRYGRPEIASDDERASAIVFNVSHTSDLILCGVTYRHALGVDVENWRDRRAPLSIARSWPRREAGALAELDGAARDERFFCYWTLKEAYVKARGMGLSLSLNACGVEFPAEGRIRVWLESDKDDESRDWRFWLLAPSARHRAAVCVRRDRGSVHRLAIRKVVPLQSSEPLSCPILRQSEPDEIDS